jgi:uncharacterized membrane protein YsdA (DUF1294 family)
MLRAKLASVDPGGKPDVNYYAVFGGLAAVLSAALFAVLVLFAGWPIYLAWLVAVNPVTFLMYGLDKGLAKADGPRVPEWVLHILALVGGFLGGWLGRAVFRHKTNARQKPLFPILLAVSTVGHGVLIYLLLIA